jgi:uncharacterized lipoprotein YddW (UPF0748 family)
MQKAIFLAVVLATATFQINIKAQQIPQEMRGIWVATVANIDWPSRPGLDAATQQAEAIEILDRQKEHGMNAVFLQIRPAADALYESKFEPWSRFLTGQQGTPPNPYYDPLQFWIEEAHKRGLELHAWINPFRATFGANDNLHPLHAMNRHPEWLLQYGERYYYDPGIPSVRQHLLNVVADIVTRYDIDGMHMDDYFYPYPLAGIEFPDTLSFQRYGSGIREERDDWRRNNINKVIKGLNDTIKHHKPWVKFGVSPFGVWRNIATDPRGSDTRAGVQCYDDLYADILLWEQEGWIDYVIPQIYWTTQDLPANFIKLINWWNETAHNRHLYIGHGFYRINQRGSFWENPSEIPNQIRMGRKLNYVLGAVHFSERHFKRTDIFSVNDSLKNDLYALPSLTPKMPWIDTKAPDPVFILNQRGRNISWQPALADNPLNESKRFVVYLEPASSKAEASGPVWFITGETHFELQRRPWRQRARFNMSVIAVDRMSNQSPKSETVRLRY